MANANDESPKDGHEPFLARWSRRKSRPEPVRAAPLPRETVQDPVEPDVDLSALPSIDELNANSDFTAFLKRGVPEALKQAALRKAWASDPLIRDFIEVAENQYNFNDPNGVPGFGELAKDTDIAALVRQAIGEPAPKPVEVVDAEMPTEVEEAAPTETSTDLATAQSQDVAHLGEAVAPDVVLEPEAAVQVGLPRRHGGALPGADSLG